MGAGFINLIRRPIRASLYATLIALAAMLAVATAPARADGVGVNEQPLDGFETDGTVYAVKIIGSTAFIGGEFSLVRAPNGSTLPRVNLAAIDMVTGNATSFRADTNDAVRTIEGDSVDLWIGGKFTTVDGVTRNRLAVLNTATGEVRTGINPGMSGSVNTLRKSGSYMYVGGGFSKIGGVTYDRIARLSLVDGSPDPGWDVAANAAVNAIAIPDAGDVIYVAGNFTAISGEARSYIAGVSATTGDVTTPQFESLAYPSLALDVTPSGDRVLGGIAGTANRLAVWDPTTGNESWRIRVGGDVQAVKYFQGNVYFGFHDEYQGNSFIKILSADAYTGTIEPWRPGIPSFWGVRAIDASATHGVAVGGQFSSVEGIATRNVAIFRPLSQADSTPPTTPQNLMVTSAAETQISLSWDAATDNVAVTAYTVWRDGSPVGVTVGTTFDDTGNLPGQDFSYTVTAGDNAANESSPAGPLNAATLDGFVSVGDNWNYLDDGSDQGTAWRQVGFDDSSWATGPAELGFGDGGEATELASGAITYYFRRDFLLASAPTEDVTLAVKRDDGVVVYLNGVEVWRDNMPAGPITFATHAVDRVGSSDESVFFGATVPAAAFQAGGNEIAVEVHQVGASSTDVSFDLALWGDGGGDNEAPSIPTGLSVVDVTETTVDLTWDDSTDNTAVTNYVVRRDGTIVGNVPNPGFRDTDLSPDTTYDYTVEAVDAAGNESGESAAKSATTEPDTTPPSSPTPLNIVGTTMSSVSLSWGTSTDNIALAGYTVRRDGADIVTTVSTSYTDNGLDPATAYEYQVVAVDAAGNESAPAGPENATTDVDDRVFCNGEVATIVGTPGDDVIEGTADRDVIHGLGGDDIIKGREGDDVICGGDGRDKVVGNLGDDILLGGDGKDVLKGKDGDDLLKGNKGRDRLVGGLGNDNYNGGRGVDMASFAGEAGPVVADLVTGTSTGQGADTLSSIEKLEGTGDADTLRGDADANRLIGRGGNDLLFGRGGNDVILGKAGADELTGSGGDDLLKGGKGPDQLSGGSGFDTLRGGPGADTCTGGEIVTSC